MWTLATKWGTESARRVIAQQLRYRSTSRSARPGLFSIAGLLKPTDFMRLSQIAMAQSDRLRDSISSDIVSRSHAVETLYQLDEISKTICNVIDAAELCRNAHASEEWRRAANETFGELQQYIASLNADQRLYEALATVDHKFGSELTEEEARFCFLLKREFELDGIHLPDQQRDHVQQIHEKIVGLETLWMSNITNSKKNILLDSASVETVLPRHVLQANGAIYEGNEEESRVRIVSDSPISNSLLSYSSNGDLRKQVHFETMTNIPQNKEVLDALIHQRHALAEALGFENYAIRSLQDKMAKTPKAVSEFLKDLEKQIAPQYKADLEFLSRAKMQIEGNSQIEAWDVKFYTKLLKTQLDLDPNELVPYLGLQNSLNGLQILIRRLFGIEMREETMSDDETWDIDDMSNVPSGRIRKFLFYDIESEKPLGTIYLDLYTRPGKYTHAAHFTVRCGCRMSGPDSEYQLPIVALVCNMNSGSAALTSHSEVETLFHEMGHAVHSLLSRTNFQHMAGTRASMDFIETPSHWLEHFVWDPEFLSILCQANGQVLADDAISALSKSRNRFRCIEMQNQILLSTFDQDLFSGPAISGRPQLLWENLHERFQIPYSPDSHFYTSVGHFVTYGVGYYGYLYSQVFADAIWNELFKGNSMNKSAGELFWKKVLIHGGAKDPHQMLHDLLGGKRPTSEKYWRNLNG